MTQVNDTTALFRAPCSRCDMLAAGEDTHTQCVICLGKEHATSGLLVTPSCAACMKLSPEVRQKRFDYVVNTADVLILDLPDELSVDRVSPHSFAAPALNDDDIESLHSLLEARSEADEAASQRSGVPLRTIRGDFPRLIEMAANLLGIPMPAEDTTPSISQPNVLQGSTYDHPTQRRERELPPMPALKPFLQASWPAPATARAPVAAYNPFTQVVKGMQPRDPPPMGNVLAAHLAPGTAGTGTTKSPQLPGKQERALARLYGTTFILSTQVSAANDMVCMMAAALETLLRCRDSLPAHEIRDVRDMLAAILHMNQAIATSAGRAIAASVVGQRTLWLGLSSMSDAEKAPLLNAPLSYTELFGGFSAESVESHKRREEERDHYVSQIPMARQGSSHQATRHRAASSDGASRGRQRQWPGRSGAPRRASEPSGPRAAQPAPPPVNYARNVPYGRANKRTAPYVRQRGNKAGVKRCTGVIESHFTVSSQGGSHSRNTELRFSKHKDGVSAVSKSVSLLRSVKNSLVEQSCGVSFSNDTSLCLSENKEGTFVKPGSLAPCKHPAVAMATTSIQCRHHTTSRGQSSLRTEGKLMVGSVLPVCASREQSSLENRLTVNPASSARTDRTDRHTGTQGANLKAGSFKPSQKNTKSVFKRPRPICLLVSTQETHAKRPHIAMTTSPVQLASRDTQHADTGQSSTELHHPFPQRPPMGYVTTRRAGTSSGRGSRGICSLGKRGSPARSTAVMRTLRPVEKPLSTTTVARQNATQRICPAVPPKTTVFSEDTLDGSGSSREGCNPKNRDCSPFRERCSDDSPTGFLEQKVFIQNTSWCQNGQVGCALSSICGF